MKKWWGIRHIRYSYYCWKLDRALDQWKQITGMSNPNPNDVKFLKDVLDGKE